MTGASYPQNASGTSSQPGAPDAVLDLQTRRMPLVSKCCCCDLKTGAMILGWLGLIHEIGTIVSGVKMLSVKFGNIYGGKEYGEIMPSLNHSSMVVHSGALGDIDYGPITEKAGYFLGWHMISNGIIGVLRNASLIYGTLQRKRFFLLPWLISDMIAIVGYGLLFLLFGLFVLIAKEEVGPAILVFIFAIPILALQVYFWICVQSLYKIFTQEEKSNTRITV